MIYNFVNGAYECIVKYTYLERCIQMVALARRLSLYHSVATWPMSIHFRLNLTIILRQYNLAFAHSWIHRISLDTWASSLTSFLFLTNQKLSRDLKVELQPKAN